MAGLALIMISAFSTPHSASAGSNTPWVNDSNAARGGYYLDPLACQIWTPDRGWHRPASSGPILWVNHPYGPAGGFYWDPLSCMVWTSDASWHTFNPAGVWTLPVPTPVANSTTGPNNPTPSFDSGATIKPVAKTFTQGDWNVTMYSGRTDRIENWFHQIKNLNPRDCLKFPNVDNACTSGFKASYGMQYGKYIDTFCQTRGLPCAFVNSPGHIRYVSADYDLGFDACSRPTPKDEGCLHINVNVSESENTDLNILAKQGFTLTGVFFDSDHMDMTLYGVGSHVAARMLNLADSDSAVNDGGNCSNIGGCPGIRVAVSITSGNELIALAVTHVRR